MTNKDFTEKESLALITEMIGKAKDSQHDTGIAAMMWGSVITVCSLVKLTEIHFSYRLPFDIYLLTVLAVIPQIYLTIKENREKRVRTYNEVALDYTWLAFGISIFLMSYIANTMFAAYRPMADSFATAVSKEIPFRFSEFSSSLFLVIYGIPTFITGAVMKFKPMLWGGIICWVCAVICVSTPVKIDLLLTALSATAAWLIPGIILFRKHQQRKQSMPLHV